MASFPLENAHFPYPRPFNSQFENVPIGVDGCNFACPSLRHIANYSYKKFSSTSYLLATVHPWRTDRRTDDNRIAKGRPLSLQVRPFASVGPINVLVHVELSSNAVQEVLYSLLLETFLVSVTNRNAIILRSC